MIWQWRALLLVLCASAAVAAPPQQGGAGRWRLLADTVFYHVARDHDLPSTGATSVTQDRQGFIWIGTQNGLARWDGYRFRLYKSISASPDTLPDNYIQTLYADRRGRLWVGTASGGVARYDHDHDRFIRYPVGGPNGLSDVSIWNITEDGAGDIWVATAVGLDHLPSAGGPITHLRHNDRNPGSPPAADILAMLCSSDGSLWVGSGAGVVRRGPGSRDFLPLPLPTPSGKAVRVYTFFEDTQHRVWMGTNQGAYILESGDTHARQVLESNSEHSTLSTQEVNTIAEARPGEIWLGTLGGGIVVVDATSFYTHRIRHDPTLPESLADDGVVALYQDRSGLIWICTYRAISRYDPRQTAILTLFGGLSRRDSVSEPNVTAIVQMPGGRLWLGLESNGIDVVDPLGVRSASLRPDASRPETSLPPNAVTAFARAESGYVYVGTTKGLYRVDPAARRASRLTLSGLAAEAPIRALLLKRGVLWVGRFDGLWAVEPGASADTRTVLTAAAVSGLTDQRVFSLEPDPVAGVWVGTGNGLNHVDSSARVIERVLPDANDPASISGSMVTTLLTDKQARLWVGTFGGGIHVLEGRDHNGRPRFHRLSAAQGLANENINMLLADSRGDIWASTDGGLALINPVSFTIRNLGRAEGVTIAVHWTASGTVTDAGEVLFGGDRGVTVVRPDRLNVWSYRPPVVVTDVRTGGRWVSSSYLNIDGTPQRPLTILAGANSLAVEFAALDYSAPERNRYAYRLEGFDADWTQTEPSRRLAAYTNLPPGDYRLHLKGSNRDGVWTGTQRVVPFRVLPAWFQTLTFKVLVGLVLTGLLAVAYRLRIRYIADRLQQRHQARLAERDRIARELHDTLLQSTEGLILNVHSVVDQLAVDDPRRALLAASVDRASQLAYEGRERIQGLRDGARTRPEMGQMLEKVARDMVQGSALRIELQLEGRVRELRPYVWEELYRMGYEALWNAYRHARATQITVLVSYGERELLVRIADDGRGIDPGLLESAEASGHFGVAGMRERARGMDAKLHIESSAGGGTRVEIRISSRLAWSV